jgi:hypothetical protein
MPTTGRATQPAAWRAPVAVRYDGRDLHERSRLCSGEFPSFGHRWHAHVCLIPRFRRAARPYAVYKLAEDYIVVRKVMGKTVQVPTEVSLVAVLIGGALMGIAGALMAIPASAAIRLFLQEVVFRRLDTS